MVEALRECKDFLTGFGGHPIAAGLSINFSDYQNICFQSNPSSLNLIANFLPASASSEPLIISVSL